MVIQNEFLKFWAIVVFISCGVLAQETISYESKSQSVDAADAGSHGYLVLIEEYANKAWNPLCIGTLVTPFTILTSDYSGCRRVRAGSNLFRVVAGAHDGTPNEKSRQTRDICGKDLIAQGSGNQSIVSLTLSDPFQINQFVDILSTTEITGNGTSKGQPFVIAMGILNNKWVMPPRIRTVGSLLDCGADNFPEKDPKGEYWCSEGFIYAPGFALIRAWRNKETLLALNKSCWVIRNKDIYACSFTFPSVDIPGEDIPTDSFKKCVLKNV